MLERNEMKREKKEKKTEIGAEYWINWEEGASLLRSDVGDVVEIEGEKQMA